MAAILGVWRINNDIVGREIIVAKDEVLGFLGLHSPEPAIGLAHDTVRGAGPTYRMVSFVF